MMDMLGMRRLEKAILAQDKCRKAQIWDVKSDTIANQSSKQLTRQKLSGRYSEIAIW